MVPAHRIGNDIHFIWQIFRQEDIPYPLTGRSLSLVISAGAERVRVTDYSVSGNSLSFAFPGKDQVRLGVHDLILVIQPAEEGQEVIDARAAFRLVPVTRQNAEPDTSEHTYITETLKTVLWSPYPESSIPNTIARTSWVSENFALKNGSPSESFEAFSLEVDTVIRGSSIVGEGVFGDVVGVHDAGNNGTSSLHHGAGANDIDVYLPSKGGTLARQEDNYTKTQVGQLLGDKANSNDVYDRQKIDTIVRGLAGINGNPEQRFYGKEIIANGFVQAGSYIEARESVSGTDVIIRDEDTPTESPTGKTHAKLVFVANEQDQDEFCVFQLPDIGGTIVVEKMMYSLIDQFLRKLGPAMNGTWTRNGYSFTFTPNA